MNEKIDFFFKKSMREINVFKLMYYITYYYLNSTTNYNVIKNISISKTFFKPPFQKKKNENPGSSIGIFYNLTCYDLVEVGLTFIQI
jgi:hypothetical protein